MLRAALVSEAQDLIEDPDYWTAARLTTLFNRGQRDIANSLGVTVSGYFIFESVQGQRQYQLPQDWNAFDLIAYRTGGTTYEIRIKPNPRSIVSVVTDPTDEGMPELAFIWAKEDRRELWIYPTFDTGGINVEIFYWRRPPDIVADNDESLLPRDWHTFLVDYAVHWIEQQDNERGWNFALFENWWKGKKVEISASATMQSAAHDNIRFGDIDNTLPPIAGHFEDIIRTPVGDW